MRRIVKSPAAKTVFPGATSSDFERFTPTALLRYTEQIKRAEQRFSRGSEGGGVSTGEALEQHKCPGWPVQARARADLQTVGRAAVNGAERGAGWLAQAWGIRGRGESQGGRLRPRGESQRQGTSRDRPSRAKPGQKGAVLWRVGTTGKSRARNAEFWSLEHPHSPGFAKRYGIPEANLRNADFIESAVLPRGGSVLTRESAVSNSIPAVAAGCYAGGARSLVLVHRGSGDIRAPVSDLYGEARELAGGLART